MTISPHTMLACLCQQPPEGFFYQVQPCSDGATNYWVPSANVDDTGGLPCFFAWIDGFCYFVDETSATSPTIPPDGQAIPAQCSPFFDSCADCEQVPECPPNDGGPPGNCQDGLECFPDGPFTLTEQPDTEGHCPGCTTVYEVTYFYVEWFAPVPGQGRYRSMSEYWFGESVSGDCEEANGWGEGIMCDPPTPGMLRCYETGNGGEWRLCIRINMSADSNPSYIFCGGAVGATLVYTKPVDNPSCGIYGVYQYSETLSSIEFEGPAQGRLVFVPASTITVE